MKVSIFGEFMRRQRLKRGILLKEMADVLGVTSSYLSAVEFGKRNIPKSWRDIIINEYAFTEIEVEELDKAISDSVMEITIDLKEKSIEDRNLIFSFARNLDSMDEGVRMELIKIFNKENKNNYV